MQPNILIFGYGNPSRGDDALGPLLLEQLQASPLVDQTTAARVELLTDFQLQIEHTLDMLDRDAVVFVDAHTHCPAPCTFSSLTASEDYSYTTHALPPGALLRVFQEVHPNTPLPPAFLLNIRGYQFELGTPLSPEATANLAAATQLMTELLSQPDLRVWQVKANI